MKRNKRSSISATEALVLDQLRDAEQYGLQLVEASGGRLKRGTIYVTLGRMERKGFVASRQETQVPGATGLPRRLYKATAYGVQVLDAYERLRHVLALRPFQAST